MKHIEPVQGNLLNVVIILWGGIIIETPLGIWVVIST